MKGAMSALLLGFLALSIAACLTSPATADQSLSEKSQNPIGDLISVPFQDNADLLLG
jgi:starvation-inducible outer membrane lipoprotein